MDYYSEYNRIRRNLIRQAKYHNIKITHIPTARQLLKETGKKEITKANLKTISVQKQSFKKLITPKNTKIKIPNIKIPKVKNPKKENKSITKYANSSSAKRGRKPNYKKYASRYGTVFTKTSSEGYTVDKFNGEVLGYSGTVTDEELGKYIYDNYRDEKTKKVNLPEQYKSPKKIHEIEYFKYDIQQRINSAFADLQAGGKGASGFGIEVIQNKIDEFSPSDWLDAYDRFSHMSSIVQQYIDEALYYTEQVSDHTRAIVIISNILDIDVNDFNIEEAENSFYDYESTVAGFYFKNGKNGEE